MVTVLYFISTLADILSMAIFVRALLSWFSLPPTNAIVVVLNQVTDPVLAPLRRVVPSLGMMDITPLVAIVLLQIISRAASSV